MLVDMRPATVAQFGGECPECGQAIKPGQSLRKDLKTQMWVHEKCPPVVKPAVCPKCWQTYSVDGHCGCYD